MKCGGNQEAIDSPPTKKRGRKERFLRRTRPPEFPLQFDDALQILPPGWRTVLAGRAAEAAPGMGGASIFRISDPATGERYLKLACGAEALALSQEIVRTEWLSSRHIRVPEFLMTICTNEVAAVLMAAVPGRHPAPQSRPGDGALPAGELPAVVRAIGAGLARLHALPVAECPFDEMPRTRLARAREAIDRNEVDAGAFDGRNAGVTPAVLYRRLAGAVPAREDVVVVHGDATLENMLIGPDGELGFIDCGHAGRSDRYLDLAIVEEQLRTAFGSEAAKGFIAAYGIRDWDDGKAAFFSDLYELF
jgi:aminoglycoside phosphotransferase